MQTELLLDELIPVLIQVESNGDDKAIGAHGEYGCLQITKAVVADYNAHHRYEKVTHDMMFDRAHAVKVARWYLGYWGHKHQNRTGTLLDYQTLARIWNGGPYGATKHATTHYWLKVSKLLK